MSFTYTRSKLPRHVVKDEVKWVIMQAKIILSSLSMWPENQNKITAVLSFLSCLSLVFFLMGGIAFIKRNISNFAETVAAAAVIIIVIQTIIKQILLIYFKKRISRILSTIYFEFWPSDIAGKDLQKKLSTGSWYLVIYCLAYTITSGVCGLQYIVAPLITGKGDLPFLTYYYFVESDGVLYAVLYVWQSFMCEVLSYTFGGFDFLFASLMWNCIAQFKILRHFFKSNFKKGSNVENDKALLIKCILHHDKIIRTCKEIEELFSFFLLTVSLSNVVALCVASFLLTTLPSEFGKMITYLLGFLGELFICSFLGTQLTFESAELSKAVFESSWYLPHVSTDVTKSLIMVMIKSQKEVQLTIGGFSTLSLTTFVEVLRFSFSLYTLLNSMLERRR